MPPRAGPTLPPSSRPARASAHCSDARSERKAEPDRDIARGQHQRRHHRLALARRGVGDLGIGQDHRARGRQHHRQRHRHPHRRGERQVAPAAASHRAGTAPASSAASRPTSARARASRARSAPRCSRARCAWAATARPTAASRSRTGCVSRCSLAKSVTAKLIAHCRRMRKWRPGSWFPALVLAAKTR